MLNIIKSNLSTSSKKCPFSQFAETCNFNIEKYLQICQTRLLEWNKSLKLGIGCILTFKICDLSLVCYWLKQMLFQANKLMLTHSLVSTVLNTFFNTFVPDKKKNKMKRKNFKIFPSFSNVYYLARLKMFNLGYYSNKEEEGLEQSKSQSEDQTVCVPGLCTQHSLLQQWSLDHLCKAW